MKSRSISSQVILSFIVFSVLFALSVGYSIFSSYQQKKISMEVMQKWYPLIGKSSEINLQITKYRAAQVTLLATQTPEDQKKWSDEVESISQNLFIYKKTLDSHLSDMNEQKSAKIFEEFNTVWDQYQADHENFLKLIVENKKVEAFEFMEQKMSSNFKKSTQLISQISDEGYLEGAKLGETAVSDFKNAQILQIGLSSFCLFMVFGLSYFLSRSIRNRLLDMSDNLFGTAQEFQQKSIGLAQSADELSAAASESAAGLEESAASMEEMTSVVKLNTANAHQASELSAEGQKSVQNGQLKIQELLCVMHEISQSSKKIEDILNLIDDIAFQTNLLSLNAAVEAARAGEQGRGFAVVADAVRQLAQKSGEAAKDISGLIQQSTEKTEQGVQLAEECNDALAEIVTSSSKITDLVKEVSVASDEQLKGVEQVSDALSQLDTSIQQNAQSTSEVAQISQEIKDQSEMIIELVQRLKTIAGVSENKSKKEELEKINTQEKNPLRLAS